MNFIYCSRRDYRLAVLVCEARGCSHLKKREGEYLCGFIPSKVRLLKRRMKKKRREQTHEGLDL